MTEGSSPASPASMVERVARAIFDAMDIADGLDGTVAEKYARAAIEAMREHLVDGHETTSEYWPTIEMIDEALK